MIINLSKILKIRFYYFFDNLILYSNMLKRCIVLLVMIIKI